MTTGEGIFWGLTVVGVVWLYTSTKDRWKWKRIMRWFGIVLLIPIIGVGGWLGYTKWDEARPKAMSKLWGIELKTPLDEVVYLKGQPTDKQDGGCEKDGEPCPMWIYNTGDDVYVLMTFRNGKVRSVEKHAPEGREYGLSDLQGLGSWSSQQDVEEKFGKPDHVSETPNRTRRMASFGKYNVIYTFEKNKVVAFGVFDSTHGPMRYGSDKTK